MGVCVTYNTLSCRGKLPQRQKCLCRGNVRKRKSPHPRRKPQQTWLVTQKGRQRRERQGFTVIFRPKFKRVARQTPRCFIMRYLKEEIGAIMNSWQRWKRDRRKHCPLSEAWIRSHRWSSLCPDIPQTCGCDCLHKWIMSVCFLVMDWQTGQSVSLVCSCTWLAPTGVSLERKDNKPNDRLGETDREALWDEVKREVTSFSDPGMCFCCLPLKLKQRWERCSYLE